MKKVRERDRDILMLNVKFLLSFFYFLFFIFFGGWSFVVVFFYFLFLVRVKSLGLHGKQRCVSGQFL